MLKKIRTISEKVQTALAICSGGILFFLSFMICADALGRSFFTKPIKGVYEISTIAITVAVYLGLAFALMKGSHVRTTLVTDRIPRLRPGSDILAFATGFLFFGLLCYAAWSQFWSSWVVKETMLAALIALPLWPTKLAIFAGAVIMCAQLLIYLMNSLSEMRK